LSQVAYIYALRDPRDRSIRYIGKTDAPERRFKEHLESKGRIGKLVKEISLVGLALQFQVLQECLKSDWQLWEKYWISLGIELGEKLLNIMPGGQNPPIQNGSAWRGRKHSQLTKEKMSAAKIGRHPPNYGKKASLEFCEKNRLAHLGIRHSTETRARMSSSMKGKNTWSRGRKLSEEHRAKVRVAVKNWWNKRRGILCK